MRTYLTTRNCISFVIGLLLVVAVFRFATHQLEQVEATLLEQLAELDANVQAVATLTDAGQATPAVQAAVRDCEPQHRENFDRLLSELGNLTMNEVRETQDLFAACGDYFATQKAVMVTLLEQQVAALGSLATVADTLLSDDVWSLRQQQWVTLTTLERERSNLLWQLVSLQADIIRELNTGVSATSPVIDALRIEANEARETLSLKGVQIDAMRTSLNTP